MSEYLDVDGIGATRDSALDDADRQARAYFGTEEKLRRKIGRAEAKVRHVNGRVQLWTVNVEYGLDDSLDWSGVHAL